MPGQGRLNTSPGTGSDKKEVDTAARFPASRPICPSAHCHRGTERGSGDRRRAREETSKQPGTGTRNRDWSAGAAGRHVNPNRGPWRVYATAPLVQGSSQISSAQYAAIPPSPCRGTRLPVQSHHIVDASSPCYGAARCFSQAHARHALKRLVLSRSKTVYRRPFSLTQYNHAWPRGDRGHQINRTGSPLNGPTTSPRNL